MGMHGAFWLNAPAKVPGVGILCRAVDAIVSHAGVYTSFVPCLSQQHVEHPTMQKGSVERV